MNLAFVSSPERPDMILDLDRLKNNCNNSLDIVAELLAHLHQKSGPKWIAAIEKGLQTGNSEEIKEVCHGMKGASATVFAWRISNIALELENLAREGAVKEISARMPALRNSFDELAEWVKNNPDLS